MPNIKKYNTPEEAHAAKLRQQRENYIKRKQDPIKNQQILDRSKKYYNTIAKACKDNKKMTKNTKKLKEYYCSLTEEEKKKLYEDSVKNE